MIIMKVNTLLNNSLAAIGIILAEMGNTNLLQGEVKRYVQVIYQIGRGQANFDISNERGGEKYLWSATDFLVILQYSDLYPHRAMIWRYGR